MSAALPLAVAEVAAPTATPASWVLTLAFDADGRQAISGVPLVSRGPYRAFLSGFLHDRDALCARTRLEQTVSDADLALALYEREGDEGLQRLRGSFAVAVVDPSRRRAVVMRDPLGFHPLFVTETRGASLFSPSALQLVQQPGVVGDLNRPALADHLCHRWPDLHETFFLAVRRVPPGWRAVVAGGRVRPEPYWRPAPDGQPIEFLTEHEASDFDEIFDRAVDRCLDTGRSGVFLSGGLDSISVAAVAADHARRRGTRPPVALSLGFSDPDCDEREAQREVAGTLGLPLVLVDFDKACGPRGLLEPGLTFNADASAPVLNPWTPAYDALAREAHARGVETIMTGSGGDEWLGVSPYLAADLIHRGRMIDLAGLAAMWHRSYRQSWLQVSHNTLWKFGLRPLAGLWLDRVAPEAWQRSRAGRLRRHDPVWVAPSEELRAEQQTRAVAALPVSDPPGGFYTRECRTCLDNPLVAWEREEQFTFGQRTGVRLLHPFWDADLLAHVYRLPPAFLNRGGRSKAPVREALARRFPGLGLERQRKVTAVAFFRSLLARELSGVVRAIGDVPGLAGLGIVDRSHAMQMVRRVTSDPDASSIRELHGVWELLNLESWVRQHIG